MRENDGRPASSLDRALAELGVPVENHSFIRSAMRTIDVARFEVTETYVRAVRADGGRDLRIAWGYTNGFASREEALRAAEGGAVDRSTRFEGAWYIAHPVNSIRPETSVGARHAEPDFGTCAQCFTARSANGACLCE